MAWTNLTFTFGSLLTSAKMTQLSDNVTLLRGSTSNIEIFTTSGTYTKPADLQYVKVTVVAGGGGSGGAASNGGGGGGASIKWISEASIGATETVTVGAGGAAGGGASSGSDGGTSSFGSHCSATGGAGATSVTTNAPGGVGSSGDINIDGGVGYSQGAEGNGGGSLFGHSSKYSTAPTTPGAGAPNDNGELGVAGADGIIIVEEFF